MLCRLLEDDSLTDVCEDEYDGTTGETLLVTFSQFLIIISDMLGTETVLSPSFGRAVTQVYLSEVDEIVKTVIFNLSRICSLHCKCCFVSGISMSDHPEFMVIWLCYDISSCYVANWVFPGMAVFQKAWYRHLEEKMVRSSSS